MWGAIRQMCCHKGRWGANKANLGAKKALGSYDRRSPKIGEIAAGQARGMLDACSKE